MPIFDVAMSVRVFVVPETFTLVVKMFDVVSAFVMNALPRTYRLVVPGRALMPMFEVAMSERRFGVAVTLRAAPKIEAALRVVTFVLPRFDVDVTFITVAKRLAAFIIRALPLV